MQDIQIDILKQEIEDNKKDLEFNRVLEIVYKQFEYTNIRLSVLVKTYHF